MFGSIAASLATKLGLGAKSDIVEALKQGSIFSDILQESFRYQLLSLSYCFILGESRKCKYIPWKVSKIIC